VWKYSFKPRLLHPFAIKKHIPCVNKVSHLAPDKPLLFHCPRDNIQCKEPTHWIHSTSPPRGSHK
jgi:hypothetical protein